MALRAFKVRSISQRSASLNWPQQAISSKVRKQPKHQPVLASIVHTPQQGDKALLPSGVGTAVGGFEGWANVIQDRHAAVVQMKESR